ncbi:helix-turn-helix transcriptional regulator [Streptomyces sp. NPDC020800]|uniref:helix-turn-helix transcriptional regulator n=1 Tax=Streptomyces sp. NPDC020800 TaxID=3365092 RepID=UPI00379AEBF1
MKTTEPLGLLGVARIQASLERNPAAPAAPTVRRLIDEIQLLRDEIDRLKSPQLLAEWEPDVECPLTRRQLEVLIRTANGENCEQIGPHLGIDPKSVRKHRQGAMRRLGVNSTPSAIAVSLVNGWFPNGALNLPALPRRVSRVVARNTYRERAGELRKTPGEWGVVAHYASSPVARQSAYRLRTGAFKAFRPTGSWEAEAYTQDGTHGVRARFIGIPNHAERNGS